MHKEALSVLSASVCSRCGLARQAVLTSPPQLSTAWLGRMQADAAANKHLTAINPALEGTADAVVNLGAFACGGEALAPLLCGGRQVLYDADLDS